MRWWRADYAAVSQNAMGKACSCTRVAEYVACVEDTVTWSATVAVSAARREVISPVLVVSKKPISKLQAHVSATKARTQRQAVRADSNRGTVRRYARCKATGLSTKLTRAAAHSQEPGTFMNTMPTLHVLNYSFRGRGCSLNREA